MRAPKSYRPWTPTQSHLLPPSPLEWLSKDHLAYFVLDLVSQLDLSAIEGRIAEQRRWAATHAERTRDQARLPDPRSAQRQVLDSGRC